MWAGGLERGRDGGWPDGSRIAPGGLGEVWQSMARGLDDGREEGWFGGSVLFGEKRVRGKVAAGRRIMVGAVNMREYIARRAERRPTSVGAL